MINQKVVTKKVSKVLKNILNWGYTANETGSAFTKRVASSIGKAVGVQIREGSPDINEELLKGTHIFVQPYGTQKSPDIAIFNLDKSLKIKQKTGWLPNTSIKIEVKRSKTGQAVRNSGFPTQDIVYILNSRSKSAEGTTMVLGRDLVSEVDEKGIVNLKEKLKNLKNKEPNFGSFYLAHLRPMFAQKSPDGYWLIHKDRKKREQTVIEFIVNR